MKDKQQKRFFIKMCLYIFSTSLIFESALWIIYLNQLGYSLLLIAAIQIFFSITLLGFEYISGILADKYGKKRMLIIANFCICLYAVMMIFANIIALVFVAYFIYAFAVSLISGTNESLLYDNLNDENKKIFFKFSAIMQGVAITSTFLADTISGQIVTYVNWYLIFLLTCVAHVFSVIALLFIKDVYHTTIKSKKVKIFSNLTQEFKFKKELYFLILLFAFLQGGISIMFIYGQTIFDNLKFTPSSISLVYASTSLISALILFVLPLFKKLNWNILTFILLILALVGAIFFKTQNIYFFTGIFLLLYITLVIFYIHTMNLVNQLIVDAIRATVISIMSATSSLVMIGFQIVFIFFDDFEIVQLSIFILLIVSLVIATICYGIYLVFFEKTLDQKISKIKNKLAEFEKTESLQNSKKVTKLSHQLDYLTSTIKKESVESSD